MKKTSRAEARKNIEDFFAHDNLDKEGVRKIKRLAMQFNLRLGKHRTHFCKKCCGDLRNGKIRITKTHKIVICTECETENKIKIKTS
jgi:RNase P subunit RPR2